MPLQIHPVAGLGLSRRNGLTYDYFGTWSESDDPWSDSPYMYVNGQHAIVIRQARVHHWWIIPTVEKLAPFPDIGPFPSAEDAMLHLKLIADI